MLKAFNTTFEGTPAAGMVGQFTTTVLIAGDDAKSTLAVLTATVRGHHPVTFVERNCG